GDTVTFNLASAQDAKAVGIVSFAMGAGSTAALSAIVNAPGNGTTAEAATISGLTNGDYLMIGALAWEGANVNYTEDSDYSARFVASAGAGSGTSNQLARLAYRLLTGTGDTYQPVGNS